MGKETTTYVTLYAHKKETRDATMEDYVGDPMQVASCLYKVDSEDLFGYISNRNVLLILPDNNMWAINADMLMNAIKKVML